MSDKTRNEWQKRWLLSPPIGYTHPSCWVRIFIHNLYLVDINLLFPRKSCSIGYRYPLESIDSVRKLNLVIFAHCPHMVRLAGILLNRQFRFGCLFCEPFSVKSGIEPVYLRRSNYTSTFVHIRAARNKTTQKSVRKYKFIKERV
jgi:hypothetical protein